MRVFFFKQKTADDVRISDWSSDVCSSDLSCIAEVMTDRLIIALAQLNQAMGDLSGNADAMLAARAQAGGADLIVYPELQLVGYPPEDLVLKPALVERAGVELERLAQATGDGGPAMLVGTVQNAEGDRKSTRLNSS